MRCDVPDRISSLFSLSVPLQQGLLVALTIFLLASGTTQYARKLRKKGVNLRVFEKFVPPDEKLLYQTIKKLNEGSGATTKEIAYALEQTTGKPPEADELISKLNYLQENGLLEVGLVTINDTPQIVWKA